MMTSEWNIRSRSDFCALTGAAFAEKQCIHSALFSREGDYFRKDYAVAHWRNLEQTDGLISAWTSLYKTPPPTPPEALPKEDAEGLLRRLLERNEPSQSATRYILALMLERKKLLREIDRQNQNGQPVLIYEHIPSGDVWVITDPQLKLGAMEAMQHEVARLLTEGL